MAAEGTRLTNPPRWAEALLRASLRPSDRESISGDLLEEYRAARRPALGALGANVWYLKHVASVLWRLVWPAALALAGLSLVPWTFHDAIRVGYFSFVPAPGVSLIHSLIYFWTGYHGAQRTRLIKTAMLTGGVAGVIGFVVFVGAAIAAVPGLIAAPFADPFIFVILSVYLLIELTFGVVVGTLGGFVGRWIAPAPSDVRFSLRQWR